MVYHIYPPSMDLIQARIDTIMTRLEVERQMQMMGLPKEYIYNLTRPIDPSYSFNPHFTVQNTAFEIDRINRIYFPYENNSVLGPKNNFLPPSIGSSYNFSKVNTPMLAPIIPSSSNLLNPTTKLEKSLLAKQYQGHTYAQHAQSLANDLLKELTEDSTIKSNPASTPTFKSSLKDFPSGDEGLLSMPLELDADGLPCAETPLYYKPCQVQRFGESKGSKVTTFFINGVMNTLEEASEVAQNISHHKGGTEVLLVYNSTLGLQRDSKKERLIKNNYLMPAAKLMQEQIMDFFNNASSEQILHLNAHSQGGSLLNSILPDIPKAFRDRMYIDTYGTASFIPIGMAKRVRNYWHPRDPISKLADKKGWSRAKEDGSLIILKDDNRNPLDAHKVKGGYNDIIEQNSRKFMDQIND